MKIAMKKILTVLVLCIAALCLLVSCGEKKQDEKLNLTFIVDGESFVTASYVDGQTVKEPAEIPTKEGYVFNGWYYDNGTWQQPFNVSDLNSTFYVGNYTLYARFESVVFSLNEDGMSYTVTGPARADLSGELSIPSRYLGRSVTAIAAEAFRNMDGITSLKIADSVKTIGAYAFAECDSITEFALSAGVTSVGRAAFSACANLETAYLGANITEYSASVFEGCAKLKTVMTSGRVQTIGGSAFRGCVSLESVVIPSGVKRIELLAFEGCTSLSEVSIPSAVQTIGDKAFYGCSKLSSITFALNASLTSFGSEVLRGTSITSFTLPASVGLIGNNAFSCDGLQYITFGGKVQSLGAAVFADIAANAVITYRGTCESFEDILVLSGSWSEGRTVPVICTDGKILP